MDYNFRTIPQILEYPDPTYLIENVIFKNSVILLGGYGGVGKSTVSLSIAKAMLTGDPLWGQYMVNEPGPVILIDEETPEPIMKDRITRMHFDKNLPLYVLHFEGFRIEKDEPYQKLIRGVNRIKPKLVIIDAMTDIHRLDEQSSKDMTQVMGRIRDIANQDTTILVIHHHKKGMDNMEKMARGSTAIVAGVDIEYGLFKKDDYVELHPIKQRVGAIEPIRLELSFKPAEISVNYVGKRDDILAKSIHNYLLAVGPRDVNEIHEMLSSRNVTIGIHRLRNLLKQSGLMEKSKIQLGKTHKFIYTPK